MRRLQYIRFLIPALLLLWSGAISARQTPPVQPPASMDRPPDAEGVAVIVSPERSLADTEKIYAAMPPVTYVPPRDRWAHLAKTHKKLRGSGELRVVMLGDSLVNDTSRSNWSFALNALYPKVQIVKFTCVRGGTGCWWYRQPPRIQRYVLDFQPDLVLLGGISHQNDTDSIADVIRQIRKASRAEIVLMTGPFGAVDPNQEAEWQKLLHPAAEDYRARLLALARAEKVAFLDVQQAWGEYVRASGKPVSAFKRDGVHANAEGEQILGHILIRYFAPPG